VWVLTGLWVLYRIARGWMTLSAQKPMPLERQRVAAFATSVARRAHSNR